MKSGLFWKLLLAFWLTFFAITQGIWLMVNVLNVTPVSERTLAERVAPLLLGQVSDAMTQGGLAAATAKRATFPADDQRRIDILPLLATRPANRDEDATVTRAARDPDGRAYEIGYRYRTNAGGWLRMPLGMLVLGLIGGPLFGALVAWYFVLPIRRLQRGFERIATGDLSVRISPGSHSRHDELADLIRDFDVMAGRLDQSIRARDRLLSDVSHELRSPLSRLQLAIGLAQQDPDRLAASLERIRYEGRRLDSVIRELLTLTRTENGLPAEKGYFDIADVVHSVIADAQFEAESTGILIRFDRQPPVAGAETPTLFGNAELIRWAVENVVRNAMRFSTPGQTVSIRLAYEPQANRYLIEVKDEGPGAPEGALPTLFDPFVRGEEASQGYGLGLAIAKRAVLAHGGEIEARNRSQSGLSVRIDLPVTGTGQRPVPTMQAPRAPLA
jgi:two-component system OmpR family sensor kinase